MFSIKGATENDSLKVRVYQNTVTGKAQADVLNVWAVGTYVFPVDFQILNTYGTLSWGVDCWDPANSGANNTAALVASLTVYFRILS